MVRERAIQRFAALREHAQVTPAPVAPSWCVSTIARVPELAEDISRLRLDGYRYPAGEPMHLDVARVRTLPDLSQGIDRRVTLDRIEVVITDFVVTPDTLTVVDLIRI